MLSAGGALAASREVRYGPPAAWVAPPPAPTTAAPPEGAAARVIYNDGQTRLGKDSDDSYFAYRLKILRPEALSAGNLAVTWSPLTDDFIVHRLNIIRDGKTTDVLATEKFKVIQRENNLDYAMLDGDLTATLQAAGLQVGDELEFAATIRRRDPTLGERSQGAMQLAGVGTPGAYRIRLSWPKDKTVRWRATPDMGTLTPVAQGDGYMLTYELRDPGSVVTTQGAPARFNLRRTLEYSGFESWTEVSKLLWPLYDKAMILAPDSAIRAEAARIAKATKDPGERAAAALRLVQDRIRYVYVGLDDGNYRPASADETWTRRFGDCKAKTVLLLVLLKELGVEAEPALVSSRGGDGTNERLPKPASFDHVLVRTVIGGKTYWLDGTRLGDRTLASLPQPTFVWALPLRNGPVELTAVAAEAPIRPESSMVLRIDATAGFDAPAKVRAEQVMRGDAAVTLKTSVASLSPADVDRGLKAYWRGQYGWIDPKATSWRYDDDAKTLVLAMSGEGRPEWDGEDRRLDFSNLGIAKPDALRRPVEQDQTAPWKVDFPSYARWTIVLRLPPPPARMEWFYSGKPVRQRLGGVAYIRQSVFRENILLATTSVRAFKPEITPAEAQALNERRLKFDDDIPMVYLTPATSGPALSKSAMLKAADRDPKVLMATGMSLLGDARYDDAIAAFDAAIAVDPKLAAAYWAKTEALRQKGDPAAAVPIAEKVRSIMPGNPADMMLVSALAGAGREAETLPILDKVAATRPKDFPLQMYLAKSYLAAGAFDRAQALAGEATKTAPENDEAWMLRARADVAAGQWDAALVDVDEAIRRQPVNDFAFSTRAEIMRRQGKAIEALADVEESARINPMSEAALALKGRLLTEAGRGPEALAVYDDWALTDKSGTALNAACWERGLENLDLRRAEADCASIVKRFPTVAPYWDSYALIALRDGRLKEAIGRYDRALALKPDLAPSLYGRGVTKLRAGDEAGGRADIAAAVAIAPNVGDELTKAGLTP